MSDYKHIPDNHLFDPLYEARKPWIGMAGKVRRLVILKLRRLSRWISS